MTAARAQASPRVTETDVCDRVDHRVQRRQRLAADEHRSEPRPRAPRVGDGATPLGLDTQALSPDADFSYDYQDLRLTRV